jgi:hypothetical protein
MTVGFRTGADDNVLRLAYREAVRLHVWYSPSRFSVQQGKASRELADRYRSLAHEISAEIVRFNNGQP